MRLCGGAGGSITGEHGVGYEKRNYMSWIFSEDDLEVMARVKLAFGAGDAFNPGEGFPSPYRTTAKQASALPQMGSIVGREGILADVAAFAVDGLTPQAAVAPSSYEEVAAGMRYAHAQGLAVIPWGGGAHIHVGNVPARYDIALGLSRLNAGVGDEPAGLTAPRE